MLLHVTYEKYDVKNNSLTIAIVLQLFYRWRQGPRLPTAITTMTISFFLTSYTSRYPAFRILILYRLSLPYKRAPGRQGHSSIVSNFFLNCARRLSSNFRHSLRACFFQKRYDQGHGDLSGRSRPIRPPMMMPPTMAVMGATSTRPILPTRVRMISAATIFRLSMRRMPGAFT